MAALAVTPTATAHRLLARASDPRESFLIVNPALTRSAPAWRAVTDAALPAQQERYAATKVFAVILSAIVALYGFMGWLTDNEPFKAILCLVAQGLAINMAIAARRAFAKSKWGHGLGGLFLTVGFAFWSEQGLHNAWTMDGSEISPLLTWFLCGVEPVIFWFTESVQVAKKPKTTEEIADETLAALRNGPNHEPVHRRPDLRSITGGLAGAAALVVAPAQAQGHEPMRTEPVSLKADRSTVRNQSEPDRAQARLMLAQGLTPYAVHKATRVPLSTLKRWAAKAA